MIILRIDYPQNIILERFKENDCLNNIRQLE